MASTYLNDLRIEEQAQGENSGSWGNKVNSAFSQIAEAFSYGTKQLAADSNETFTMPDGTSDGTRSLYLKITSAGSLTATRTVTLGPNTVSKLWIIENATTGSQSITIAQGSGSTVTIPTGAVKMVYSDGAGSGAAVVDALVDLHLSGSTNLASLNVDGTVSADGLTVDGSGGFGLTAPTISEGFQIHVDEAGNGVWGGFGNVYLTSNYKFNSTNKFAGTGYAQILEAVPSTGAFTFKTSSASGTADATATMQNRLNIATNGDISFYEDTGVSQSFFWDASAKSLGIGTNSPSDLITIQSPASGGGNGITIKRNDNGTDQRVGAISFGNTVDSDLAQITAQTSAGNNGDGNLLFHTQPNGGSSTERLRIDSSGNVGVGVTPSAWSTVTALQVGNAHVGALVDNAYFGANCY